MKCRVFVVYIVSGITNCTVAVQTKLCVEREKLLETWGVRRLISQCINWLLCHAIRRQQMVVKSVCFLTTQSTCYQIFLFECYILPQVKKSITLRPVQVPKHYDIFKKTLWVKDVFKLEMTRFLSHNLSDTLSTNRNLSVKYAWKGDREYAFTLPSTASRRPWTTDDADDTLHLAVHVRLNHCPPNVCVTQLVSFFTTTENLLVKVSRWHSFGAIRWPGD